MGTVTRLFDGLANILTGRGTSVDRGAHNFWMRRYSDRSQVEQAYLGSWLMRKIVDVPAQDMTRAGRDWDADAGEIERIEAEEKRLGYWPKLREAVRLGRLGGGAIFIGLGDDQEQPLPENVAPGAVKYLMVFSRWQLTLGEMETDPASPGFGQPRYFEITGLSRQLRIHPSRMVCFHGLPIPSITMSVAAEDLFWGMSVVEACDEAVQQATTACSGFASLIDEAKIDVFRFAGVVDTLSHPDGETKLRTRMEATTTGKSIHRAIWLDKEDEWEQRQLTLTGVRDVIITYDARVAGAADIPATRLFGKAPDGMNATGEGDLANYFQAIGAKQEMDLRPGMERLDAVILPSAGVNPGLTWNFSPLRVLTEKEQAEIENREADTLSKLVNTGMFSEVALEEAYSNRMVESQRWPGYGEKRNEQIAAGELDPSDEPGDPAELGIVPVGGNNVEGGDPASAGGGAPVPARRAANDSWFFADAKAKPLYVNRRLLNADELIKWAKSQGFEATLPAKDMHVTVLFSRQAVDPMKMGESWTSEPDGGLVVKAGGPRAIERFDGGAVVLQFVSWSLSSRHDDMVRAGASHDFDDYQPHVTLSYSVPADMDLDAIKPFAGELRFGPELFEPLDLDWKSKTEEA